MVTRAELERFLDGLPEHVLPVLDEAYFEYVDDPEYPDGASEHLARGRRCVVLRTFSKIYGLAGFRVGYGLCPPDVAAACLKVKNAFDVTQSALDAALASLDAQDEVARRRDETREGRERLAAGLRERGLRAARGRRQLPLRRRGRRRRLRGPAGAPGRDRAPAGPVRRPGLGAHQRGLGRGAHAPLRRHRRGRMTRRPSRPLATRRSAPAVARSAGNGARCHLAIAATLVATAVAVGAGTEMRLHRLHVPPPPTVDPIESSQPPPRRAAPPGGPEPPGPPAPPAAPPPPGTRRRHLPARRRRLRRPAASIGCTLTGGSAPARHGHAHDFAIALAPTSVAAAATLRSAASTRRPYDAQPLAARSATAAVRHAESRGRQRGHVLRHEPAAGQLRALLHHPRPDERAADRQLMRTRQASRTRATACCRRTSLEPSRSSTVLAETTSTTSPG